MAHIVKCRICGQSFNRDKYPTAVIGVRKYAHLNCAQEMGYDIESILNEDAAPQDQDLIALQNYIKKIFDNHYNRVKVNKQIKQFHDEYQYSYSGIQKTLYWFYEICGNSIEKANGGIGIVPYVFPQAEAYYYKIHLANELNKDKDINETNIQQKIVEIPSPQSHKMRKKLFSFEE